MFVSKSWEGFKNFSDHTGNPSVPVIFSFKKAPSDFDFLGIYLIPFIKWFQHSNILSSWLVTLYFLSTSLSRIVSISFL
ncbi:hypothetical protein RNN91_04355 [Mycoplasmopsis felis]|uniref:hypothetical protein n=1 Tax=Mycoplasmopsis felis TaxID=33923 RepID=UPI002AF6A4CB|nr:hypothetical protein [Mycoplasmopsis felis]WQQ01450.1 hypothetical protein RRG54_02565 [Mycoplasmopsis felis]WQQ07627.1 hypothetical protein RRG57_03220 [Mycoplasmopsis felis]